MNDRGTRLLRSIAMGTTDVEQGVLGLETCWLRQSMNQSLSGHTSVSAAAEHTNDKRHWASALCSNLGRVECRCLSSRIVGHAERCALGLKEFSCGEKEDEPESPGD